jgi:hypothetical protein
MIYKHQHKPLGAKCEKHQTTMEELDSNLGNQIHKNTQHIHVI